MRGGRGCQGRALQRGDLPIRAVLPQWMVPPQVPAALRQLVRLLLQVPAVQQHRCVPQGGLYGHRGAGPRRFLGDRAGRLCWAVPPRCQLHGRVVRCGLWSRRHFRHAAVLHLMWRQSVTLPLHVEDSPKLRLQGLLSRQPGGSARCRIGLG